MPRRPAVEREDPACVGKRRRAAGDIETLEQLCRSSAGKTFCAHAPGAVEPLQSAIKYFREEFEAGIAVQHFGNAHAIGGIQPNNLLKQRW